MRRFLTVSCLIFLCVCFTLPAGAQSRSDTGRRRAVKPTAPAVVETETGEANSETWSFGVSAGLLGAGRAFQVETANGASVPWDLGSGNAFQASRFNATFDQNLSFGIDVNRDWGKSLRFGASLGYARMDLGAEALAGQQGLTVLLERFDVIQLGLETTFKLVSAPDYPFVTAGAVWTQLGPARLNDLEQSGLGWRVGAGYRRVVSENWAAKVQARLSRTGFDIGEFLPGSPLIDPPLVEIESEDHLTFFEIMLSLEFH